MMEMPSKATLGLALAEARALRAIVAHLQAAQSVQVRVRACARVAVPHVHAGMCQSVRHSSKPARPCT